MLAPQHAPNPSAGNSDDHAEAFAQPDVSLNSDNFWGLALRFRNADIEERYQAEALRAKLCHDAQVHLHGLFPGFFLVYRHWQWISWWGVAAMLSLSMITAPTCLYICLYKRSFYQRFRTPLIIFINLHSMSMFHFLAKQEHSATPTFLSLLGLLVLKSPITVGVYFSMNGNLTLHHNIILQSIVTPVFLLWTFNFCTTLCCCGSQAKQLFDELAAVINVTVMVLSGTVVGEERISCAAIVSSVVLFLGVLAPFALAYNLDVIRRKAFIRRNFPSQLSFDFEQSVLDTQAAMWYLVVVVQSIWIILFLIFDVR